MQCGIIIDDTDIEEYKQQLEELLPQQINGITSEGGLMVRYSYVPHSLNLEHLISHEEIDPLTPYWSGWSYQVTQSQMRIDVRQLNEEETIKDIYFSTPHIFDGYVEIPIEPGGSLVTNEIDFVYGLQTATEEYP